MAVSPLGFSHFPGRFSPRADNKKPISGATGDGFLSKSCFRSDVQTDPRALSYGRRHHQTLRMPLLTMGRRVSTALQRRVKARRGLTSVPFAYGSFHRLRKARRLLSRARI